MYGVYVYLVPLVYAHSHQSASAGPRTLEAVLIARFRTVRFELWWYTSALMTSLTFADYIKPWHRQAVLLPFLWHSRLAA
jgi:hypothetical protein